jgi:ABC-type glycerol-3-phosphate transport system permease component
VIRWDVVLGRAVAYALVLIGALIFSFPFIWMLSASVKTPGEVLIYPPRWIPHQWVFNNYSRPWGEVPFTTFYRNTFLVAGIDIVATVLSSSIVAFAFARMRFRGRSFLFVLIVSTLMLPSQVTLIPQYVLYSHIHWVNTLRPLIVPVFFGSAFNIFLLRQFMLTIPHEMDDAARIDGANWFSIYWRILIPLTAPALGVVAIGEFTFRWNDFLGPLIYLNTPDKFTIQLGLRMLTTQYTTDVPGTMAMTCVSLIPVLIVFFLAQRYFIQGIVISGIKG